ncbi:uncharacterized protein PpBr36_10256 [Pyricularia pennisetigena]|uniref:uncharacterized protein n=1 Tax=Pyricularia pennisetigena TaxID=1578925 RepID=UPI0011532BB5|nr:uncharacterized protein PpBr36_10256 [Pyricularia pennisetigena]TLS21538.1 hypothetical protein PpBr36_10256 [Pyricularia pennisetigena]
MLSRGISHRFMLVYITIFALLGFASAVNDVPDSPSDLRVEAETGPPSLLKRAQILDSCKPREREMLIKAMEK